MTQGIYVNGRRPTSKKAIKAAAEIGDEVWIEATSVFGNEYDGEATSLPEGQTVYFVGPDPYTSRKFYGTITRKGGKVVVK